MWRGYAESCTTNASGYAKYDQYEAGYQRLWVHQTDANGIVTKQAYDAFGRLVVSRDAENNDTRYNYAKQHLVGITDANDYTTEYQYDTAGRLWKTIFPDSAVESYTYFADGLLATKTDRKNNVISYVYDGHKRLVDKIYNGGADGTIHFVYQGQKLVRVENRSQGVSEDHVYTYDAGYRTASEQQGQRGTVRWEYDVRDQVSRMSVDGGPTTDYSYYPDGSMNTITWSLVSGSFKYRYTPEGQYATVTFPNGQSRNYSYDWAGRLLQLANLHPTAGNLATYSYGYDVDWATGLKTKKGQRTSMTADVPAQGFTGALTKYLYDVHYQLTGADYPSAAPFNREVARWAYDAIGNRTSETVNGVTKNYTYQKIGSNPRNWQRLSHDGVFAYAYDPRGAIIQRQGAEAQTFGYDSEGRISLEGNTVRSHDWEGRLTHQASPDGEDLYSGYATLMSTRDGVRMDFLYGQQLDEVFAITSSNGIRFVSTDALGSVNQLVQPDATDAGLFVYDAWGKQRDSQTLGPAPLRYAARELRPSGLYYVRYRDMDTSTGRFVSEDPLGTLDGPNLYAYAGSSPAASTDPLGLYEVGKPVCRRKRGQAWSEGDVVIVIADPHGATNRDLNRQGVRIMTWGHDKTKPATPKCLTPGIGKRFVQPGSPDDPYKGYNEFKPASTPHTATYDPAKLKDRFERFVRRNDCYQMPNQCSDFVNELLTGEKANNDTSLTAYCPD